MNFFNNKKILFYGPANNFDCNTDLSFFNEYDIVIINNKFIELLQPNLTNIIRCNTKHFDIVLLLNGVFTNGNPETIQKYKDQVSLFLVSENCLIGNLLNIDIPRNKIIALTTNYRKFNFIGCPNMFPKLIMLFIDYNITFTELSITGITFYMDLLDNNKITQTYHSDYHNWDTKIPKELMNLSNNDKMEFHLNRIVELGTNKEKLLNCTNVYNHFIDENFNFFLKYYKQFYKTIKLDDVLENIINKNY